MPLDLSFLSFFLSLKNKMLGFNTDLNIQDLLILKKLGLSLIPTVGYAVHLGHSQH